MSDCNPKKKLTCRSTPEKKQVTDQKPAKYTPPTHVCQFTPDFSILSFPKPRKKKRRRDDFAFLCGAVGSTSSKKGPGSKKRKKKKVNLSLKSSIWPVVSTIIMFACKPHYM